MQIVQTLDLIEGYKQLEDVHNILDQAKAELELTIKQPICIDDCGKCCKVNTPVITQLEADYIWSTYVTRPEMNGLMREALDWLEHESAGCSSKGIDDPKRLAAEVEVAQTLPCPFLQKDMKCGIYEARPLVCRSYGITMIADSYCDRPLASFETRENRAFVGADGPLAKFLTRAKNRLFNWINKDYRVGGVVGFAPFMLARMLAKNQTAWLAEHGKISDAKQALGYTQPDLFMGQQREVIYDNESIIREIEQERERERKRKGGRAEWSFPGEVK